MAISYRAKCAHCHKRHLTGTVCKTALLDDNATLRARVAELEEKLLPRMKTDALAAAEREVIEATVSLHDLTGANASPMMLRDARLRVGASVAALRKEKSR